MGGLHLADSTPHDCPCARKNINPGSWHEITRSGTPDMSKATPHPHRTSRSSSTSSRTPSLLHPQPKRSGTELRNSVNAWLHTQGGTAPERRSSQDPSCPTDFRSPPRGFSHPARGLTTPSEDRTPTPTQIVTPPPPPFYASTVADLLKSLPPDDVARLFPATVTVEVPLGDVLTQWAHNNTDINGVRINVSQTSKLSSQPTTETLGSQRDNTFLRSLGSNEAAELASKYPNPREALRIVTTGSLLPPLSEVAEVDSNPPSYRHSAASGNASREMHPEDFSRSLSNEYLRVLQHILDMEVVNVLWTLDAFPTDQFDAPTIPALKTGFQRIQSVLRALPHSVTSPLKDVSYDAWDSASDQWKRKWWRNMESLSSSMSLLYKHLSNPPSPSQNTKNHRRYIRHLATRLEDEADVLEALGETTQRLIMTLQAQYLSWKLKQVKAQLQNNRTHS